MTLLMHHHIYKNAGSTIDWILQRNFPNQVLHIEGDSSGARLTRDDICRTVAQYLHHQAISSHTTPFPDRGSTWAKCHLTMLRDPVQRLKSMYLYDRTRTDDELASQQAREADLRGYCEWWLKNSSNLIRNWQVRCCTPQRGTDPSSSDSPIAGWEADLDAAGEAITDWAFAGLVDDFDRSMVVLQSALRERGIVLDAAYCSQNTSTRETDHGSADLVGQLGAGVYADLVAANELDYELLSLARTLQEERFGSLPDGAAQLDGLRRRCGDLAQSPHQTSVRVPPKEERLIVTAASAP